ncbi:MAG: efflux RND transporter periplasmic adaptor subunit [Opitutaceae bacterium]
MKSITSHSSTKYMRHAFCLTSLLIGLGLASSAQAQSQTDHGTAEEHGHDESHATRNDHDAHGTGNEDNGHDIGSEGHEDRGEGEGEHGDEHGGPIELSPADMLDFGIQVEAAASGTIHDELRLQGEVRMNENAMGHVSPRFGGVVTSINKRLGDRVSQGEVLAEMESNETLRPFQLVAPLDGTVVSFHITPGESLSAGEVAYTIADTSTIWVDLRVYQRDLPKVHHGQALRISAGHEYEELEGEISYVGPVIDESNRTGFVRAELENPDGTYRPGLFVIGNVLLDAHQVPAMVPRSGVISMDGESVIFVQSEDGHGFEARVVTLGRTDTENVEIRTGIQPGELYVAKGGFFLKADSQKEDFGDGHGH